MAQKSSNSLTKQNIHNQLIADLINGYIGQNEKTKTYIKWKIRFKKYCSDPTEMEGSVFENFEYLENEDIISPGKYDVLIDIFQGDYYAIKKINEAAKKITGIPRSKAESLNSNRHDSQPTLKKLLWRCKSPTEKGIVEPILKATKITFEYGPPELNFFKYLAEETHFLWERAKEIQNDQNEPINSIVLIHDEDTEVAEDCLHFFDFDLPSKVPESADCLLNGKPEVICVFLLRETFWKATNIPFEQVLNNVVKNVAKANVFFMVPNEDISRAYDFCKKHNVCQGSNVISQGGDKSVFYDTFYDILERQMNSFLHALHTRTNIKEATIREELYSLIEQLRTRKIKTKPKLTTDCLERINESRKFGVVGYRLLEKVLCVFEDGPVKMEAEKRMQLENYIEKVFNGKVKIIPLREILKPHCAIECGSFITNGATNKCGTIGIFGNMQNSFRSGVEKTVALSSPNLFSEGDHACLPNGENIGVCFWPVKPVSQVENLRDVSIIEIDSSRLDTVKRTIFDKDIIVEEIPYRDLDYKKVFKYGAKTETTYGWIKKISNFQLFESDVLVILPKSPAKSFSEEGDSGAIVVTKIKGNYYGVGMVYGSHFDLENTTNNNAQIATIGIFLKNALERFTGRRNMSIQFDKI